MMLLRLRRSARRDRVLFVADCIGFSNLRLS